MDETAGPARPAPQPSPSPSPATPPAAAAGPKVPEVAASEVLPTSATHKAQWNKLARVAAGPRAKAYPQLASLWNGTPDDKRKALHQFVQSGENLDACEAQLVVKRRKTEKMSHRRRWMTIRQMREAQFSSYLGCMHWSVCVFICACFSFWCTTVIWPHSIMYT